MFFQRLADIICHPSRVGLYFKDKIHIIILYVTILLGLVIGVFALDNLYKPNSFDRKTSISVADMIITSFEGTKDVTIKDGVLEGDAEIIGSRMSFYFNREGFDKKENDFVIVFKETNAIGYFEGVKVFDVKYEDECNLNYEFSFFEIKNMNTNDKISFVEFLTPIMENYEKAYSTYVFLTNLGTIILFYGLLIVVLFIFTYLSNPTINKKIRFKLVFYNSITFLILSIFSVLLNQSWLIYAGIVLSVFYSNITFSHIIKVKIKKG